MSNVLKKNSKINIIISIIIVNYKSWEHLRNCLLSLEQIDEDNFKYEVIIVDNASNDGKLNNFSKQFSRFKFIENSGNNGFANGCNKGAQIANGDFYLFLNPDTIVSKKPILTMLRIAKKFLNYGVISCVQVNKKGKYEEQVRFFPRLITLFGFIRAIFKILNRRKLAEKFDKSKEIIFPDWISGSVIFMSKKWFKKVYGWNEDYWMYAEDIDLCRKISDIGGEIALTRKANIIHNHGGSSRLNVKTSALTKSEVVISKHVYVNNHFRGWAKYFCQFLIVFQVLISKFILAIVGVVFFFIPKMNLQFYIFVQIVKNYVSMIKRGSWLSERSMNKKHLKEH